MPKKGATKLEESFGEVGEEYVNVDALIPDCPLSEIGFQDRVGHFSKFHGGDTAIQLLWRYCRPQPALMALRLKLPEGNTVGRWQIGQTFGSGSFALVGDIGEVHVIEAVGRVFMACLRFSMMAPAFLAEEAKAGLA